MTGTIADHTLIIAVLSIYVNIWFSQFFTIVGFQILFTLWLELPVMKQEVSTLLDAWHLYN